MVSRGCQVRISAGLDVQQFAGQLSVQGHQSLLPTQDNMPMSAQQARTTNAATTQSVGARGLPANMHMMIPICCTYMHRIWHLAVTH